MCMFLNALWDFGAGFWVTCKFYTRNKSPTRCVHELAFSVQMERWDRRYKFIYLGL